MLSVSTCSPESVRNSLAYEFVEFCDDCSMPVLQHSSVHLFFMADLRHYFVCLYFNNFSAALVPYDTRSRMYLYARFRLL